MHNLLCSRLKLLYNELMNMRLAETFAPFDFAAKLRLEIEDVTLTGLELTLLGSLALQIRRILKFGRIPKLSLGVRSVASWLLGN